MTPMERRIQALESRLAVNERERRQYWPIPCAGGGTQTQSYLWQIVGGSTIPTLGVVGIPRSSSVIAPSTLPDGPAGTGIVIVPPYPVPVGLPAGIGVAQRVDPSNTTPVYSFVRIDNFAAGAYSGFDIINGEAAYFSGTTYLDKVVGATTWRYVCLSGVIGYY